ncbi:hypothetical protein HUJ05_000825 [Dendroctonus ponderosae]|nr:hypothetical protein HUJ05_000825 [Dendroctonus ponderosae]
MISKEDTEILMYLLRLDYGIYDISEIHCLGEEGNVLVLNTLIMKLISILPPQYLFIFKFFRLGALNIEDAVFKLVTFIIKLAEVINTSSDLLTWRRQIAKLDGNFPFDFNTRLNYLYEQCYRVRLIND